VLEICGIDVDADKVRDSEVQARLGRVADAHKRVENQGVFAEPMDSEAIFCQLNGEGRRVRSFRLSASNSLIGNKPIVPAAPFVSTGSMGPARNVALVLIGDSKSESVDWCFALFGEMKNVFMTIVHEPVGIDRFKVADRHRLLLWPLDRNGFDPVKGVLESE